jgi:hypothetical protein
LFSCLHDFLLFCLGWSYFLLIVSICMEGRKENFVRGRIKA